MLSFLSVVEAYGLIYPRPLGENSCFVTDHFLALESMARSHGIEFQKMYLLRFTSVARGHNLYKKIWKPVIGETLVCRHTRAEAKQYDDFAVGIYLVDDQDDGQKLVGHVPIELFPSLQIFYS